MNRPPKKIIKYASASLIILLLLWVAGPFIAIDGKILLSSVISRVILSALLLLSWGIYGVYAWIYQRRHVIIDFDFLAQSLNQLRQHTKIALTAIKKHRPRRLFHDKRPWILLLGEKESGKTTLLAHADISATSPHHSSLSTIKPTKNVDFWASDEAIFIDPSGAICFAKSEDNDKQKVWHSFLTMIKQKIQRRPLRLVLVINGESLINLGDNLSVYAEKLSQHLQSLLLLNKSLPVFLIVTQCDRLSGFTEFFSDLDSEERYQSLGFSLSHNPGHLSSHELFKKQSTAFLTRLNERLIFRLHHEQNQIRRSRINDFPFQMEQWVKQLEKIIEKLPLESTATLAEISFTSSVQSSQPINTLTKKLSQSVNFIPLMANAPSLRHKSYFIRSVFQKIISDELDSRQKTTPHWRRLLSYPIAAVIIVAGLLTWHHVYQQNIAALTVVEMNLTHPSNDEPWLSQLNMLQKSLSDLHHYGIDHDRWLGFGQVAALQREIKKTYDQLIQTHFVLYLNQIVTRQIELNMNNDPAGLYNSLQIYLLLAQPDRLDVSLVKAWFTQFWKNSYPNDTHHQKTLMQHLDRLLELKHVIWPLNDSLVQNAQKKLQQQPLEQTAFKVLQSEYKKNPTPIIAAQNLKNIDTSNATVPALYSFDNFNSVFNTEIPKLAAAISHGNWVIGSINAQPPTATQIQTLTEKIRALYVQNYVSAWESAIGQIQLNTPKNLPEVLSDIKLLSDSNSALWKDVQASLNNDVIQAHLTGSDNASTALTNLVLFLQKNGDYQNFQTALQTLSHYINNIVASPSPTQSAYDSAVIRMQGDGNDTLTQVLQMAQKLPAPANQWVTLLTRSTWKIMLRDTQQYINTLWVSSIVPEYQNHIMDRYPIFNDSKTDITETDFNRFFGPGGTVESFFNYYLKPFVDTRQIYWTWKSVDGEKIPIKQDNLDMLIRASMIQKMFYTDDPNTPTIQFNLTPINLSPNVRRFELNVGGQIVNYEPGIKRSVHLSWPGSDGKFVTLQFVTLNPNHDTLTLAGPWAWLHLLDQSRVQATSDPKTFQMSFTLNGNRAQYQVTADNPVNPYQTQLLSAFRCPDSL